MTELRYVAIPTIRKHCHDTYWLVGNVSIRPAYAELYPEVIASFTPEDPAIAICLTDEEGFISHPGQPGVPKATLLTHRNMEFACVVENRSPSTDPL